MIRGTRSGWAHRAGDAPRPRPGLAPLVVLGAAMALLMALGTAGTPVSATETSESTEDSSAGRAASRQGNGYVPMRFTAEEYRLRGDLLWHVGDAQLQRSRTPGDRAFARVRIDSRGDAERSLQFAVESQPDQSQYQHCAGPGTCYDVRVGVTNDDDPGTLYLYTSTRNGGGGHYPPLYDFTQQVVEMSAKDQDTGLAVYREVRIEPPVGSPADCGDFPDQDKVRYTCLFMHEIVPEDLPATTAAMTRALPNLVQPGDNYNLLFAEEFNDGESRTGFACETGMTALDSSVWDMLSPCRPDGNLCGDIGGGHLTISQYEGCGVELNSDSGFAFKYGYLEVKYTVNPRAITAWNNYNLLLGNAAVPLRDTYFKYGIEIDDYEDVGRYIGAVIGVVEYSPNSSYQVMQTHINHNFLGGDLDARYRRASYHTRFCYRSSTDDIMLGPTGCRIDDEFTVTLGIEWTPRGHRHFIKADGQHNELITVPSGYQKLQHNIYGGNNRGGWQEHTGAARSEFLEHLVPGDPESYLWNYAISHAPMPIHIGAWGYNYGDVLKAWMKIDYVRVFQPDNLYRDMEPVYG